MHWNKKKLGVNQTENKRTIAIKNVSHYDSIIASIFFQEFIDVIGGNSWEMSLLFLTVEKHLKFVSRDHV